MVKLNKEYFKRTSTWMNIGEALIATGIQLAIDMPNELSMSIWAYVGLRMLMAVVQVVKHDVN